jgi:ABC-type antimicrobial peptide transport system permease subunit
MRDVASTTAKSSFAQTVFGVGRLDAASYLAAATGVTLTSLISAIVPTVLALRIDPIIALRHD